MYITYKDLIWQLTSKIKELSILQNALILNNIDDLDTEATEADKEEVNKELGVK